MFAMRSARHSKVVATGLLAVTALILTACGAGSGAAPSSDGAAAPVVASSAESSAALVSSAASSSGPASATSPSTAGGGASRVTINITQAKGCVVTPDTVHAGAVTFSVKNVDA